MINYKIEQKNFWAEKFGDEYIDCNKDKILIAGNIVLFSEIISKSTGVRSVIEFGANIGNNIVAIFY